MYREFLYLDTERVQSIIAQLNEGALTEMVENKGTQLEGRARIAAGVISAFLPFGFEGAATRSTSVQSNKVLHDYAYSVALKSLEDQSMLRQVEDASCDELPFADNDFVLVRGVISLIDYSILRELAENEVAINSLFGVSLGGGSQSKPADSQNTAGLSREQRRQLERRGRSGQSNDQPAAQPADSVLQKVRQFVEMFMADQLIATLTCSSEMRFQGPLTRSFLREDIRHYIFKRGGAPQEGWAMLAQISQIPNERNKMLRLSTKMAALSTNAQLATGNTSTASDLIDMMVATIYDLQEAIASVSYPSIAVTPIAIYRELDGVR